MICKTAANSILVINAARYLPSGEMTLLIIPTFSFLLTAVLFSATSTDQHGSVRVHAVLCFDGENHHYDGILENVMTSRSQLLFLKDGV